jgi:hypothetical protein
MCHPESSVYAANRAPRQRRKTRTSLLKKRSNKILLIAARLMNGSTGLSRHVEAQGGPAGAFESTTEWRNLPVQLQIATHALDIKFLLN